MPERLRLARARGWLIPAALLALTPKCLLCVLVYAGLGAALGLGGPEICGATTGSPASWASSLAWLGGAGALGTLGFLATCWRARCAPTANSNHRKASGRSPRTGQAT